MAETGLDVAVLAGHEAIATPYGTVRLEHTFPTDESSALLFDVMDGQRAAQAYVWSLPLVGFAVFRNEQARVFGAAEFGDFVVYESLREKRGIVTANLTTPYIINFTSLADGPVQIDYPAGPTAGGVLDFWQRPVTDMGLTGPDAGPGGGYLVIGPGDDPARYAGSDRVVVQSETVNIFIAFRILSTDPAVMAGAKAALKMSRLGQDPAPRYARPYWDGTRWYKSFDFDISQETGTVLQLDQRATWFYEAVTSSEGMIHPRPGAGQVYMTSKRDSRGRLVRADRSYRLHVPPGVPVAQFWSLTLYSENTRRPYDNGGTEIRSASLDSRDPELQYNSDGSTDLYIGPAAPAGKSSNWMKTVDQDGWFVYFRLYAPTEPFFDRTWSLPDFEAITG